MNALQRLAGGAATAVALFALTAPAFAGGSLKDKPAEPRRCSFSANAALTTDYVFRGFSQTAEGPAVQAGFDMTCGMFYAGVWASSLDFTGSHGHSHSLSGNFDAHLETDLYAGIKGTTGKVAWDLGVIYYQYPNAEYFGTASEKLPYLELKAAVSTEVWKGGTLGANVFYSPDYQLESGSTWTFEGTFAQTLPTIMGRFTPTFSALYGYQLNEGSESYKSSYGAGKDNYSYWNAGLTLGLDKNWSVDVRYWDTNLNGDFCKGSPTTFQCDERVVGTLKFTY